MAEQVVVYRGGGFLPMLAVLFIALKLTGVIAWSWWWVAAPLWIPFATCIGILLVILLFGGGLVALIAVLEAWGRRK